ncbi:MAG: 4'-phosphopantetheinyl transferase superfamily protein [Clostridia bacterium]|nr:4'-phosphopantetheinyl transferase superfamily protein [Clostridia bacterium]
MQIYTYDIRKLNNDEYRKWYSMMSDDRKKRVDAFRYEDDRKRSVAGEMLARTAISEMCGIAPENITFERTRYGKPYTSLAEFNISHSEDIVVCAVDKAPVGIDIEKIRPVNLKTAKKVFSENEINYLFGHTPEEKEFINTDNTEILSRFFELWTKNEAVGKCVSTGLIHDENYDNYDIETFSIDNGYIVSVCQKKKTVPNGTVL